MKKRTDLRVVKTKQAIYDAFFELMETEGFAKITIEKLAKRALISRNTFYLHYADKFDLLEKIEDEVLAEMWEILEQIPIELVARQGLGQEVAVAQFRRMFSFVKGNSRFYTLIVVQKGDPAFMSRLGNIITETINAKLAETTLKLQLPERYIVACIVNVHIALISEWIVGGMKETPEEIAEMLTTLFGDIPKKILQLA
jgi:AcrR family transcriptional regulator